MVARLVQRWYRRLLKRRRRTAATFVHPRSRLGRHVTVGYGTNINGPAFIVGHKDSPVTIGKYCAIAYNLRIRTRNHYTGTANLQDKLQSTYGFRAPQSLKGPVSIGHNVWIGDNVIILSGVTIGNGAVIGAAAVVTKNVPAYAIAVGNPARVIGQRFADHIIAQMEHIRWWDWPEAKIRRNKAFFEADLKASPDSDLATLIVD